jgi:hypothetical protein
MYHTTSICWSKHDKISHYITSYFWAVTMRWSDYEIGLGVILEYVLEQRSWKWNNIYPKEHLSPPQQKVSVRLNTMDHPEYQSSDKFAFRIGRACPPTKLSIPSVSRLCAGFRVGKSRCFKCDREWNKSSAKSVRRRRTTLAAIAIM